MLSTTIRGAQTGSFTIPANGRIPMGVQGEFIRCLVASQQFFVSVNGGSEMYFDGGIQYTVPAMESYESFALINNTGADITVTMAWGWGEFADSRLSVATSLKVENVAGTKLSVTDIDSIKGSTSGANLTLATMNSRMVSDKLLRSPLTTLLNAAYAHVNNTTTVVVASGANLNGVIIRTLHIDGAGYVSHVKIGANYLYRSHSTNIGGVFITDIFVPAGVAIELSAVGGGAYISMAYEVL